MYRIVQRKKLANQIYLMVVHAPRVAKTCKPGQFVIVKMDERGERIPLTICDYDRMTEAMGHQVWSQRLLRNWKKKEITMTSA